MPRKKACIRTEIYLVRPSMKQRTRKTGQSADRALAGCVICHGTPEIVITGRGPCIQQMGPIQSDGIAYERIARASLIDPCLSPGIEAFRCVTVSGLATGRGDMLAGTVANTENSPPADQRFLPTTTAPAHNRLVYVLLGKVSGSEVVCKVRQSPSVGSALPTSFFSSEQKRRGTLCESGTDDRWNAFVQRSRCSVTSVAWWEPDVRSAPSQWWSGSRGAIAPAVEHAVRRSPASCRSIPRLFCPDGFFSIGEQRSF